MSDYALFHLQQFNSTDHLCFSFLQDSFSKLFIDVFQSSLFIMHAVKPRASRYIFIHSLDSNIWFTHDGMHELRWRKWICIAQILKMLNTMAPEHACLQTHTHTSFSDLRREEWVKMPHLHPASGTGLSFHGLWASPFGLPYAESITLSKGLSWDEDSPAWVETVLPMRASGSIRWHDIAGLHGIHTDEEQQKKTGHLATGAMR